MRLSDVEPGDLIAWIKRDHEPGDNTGHVVLVEEKPTAESPNQFRVRVLDSTAHGHGYDSRPEGKSGIGRGTLWLDADADGRPIGFRWKSRKWTAPRNSDRDRPGGGTRKINDRGSVCRRDDDLGRRLPPPHRAASVDPVAALRHE